MSTVCLNIFVYYVSQASSSSLTLIKLCMYIYQASLHGIQKKAIKMLYILINSFLNISMIFYFPDKIYIRK